MSLFDGTGTDIWSMGAFPEERYVLGLKMILLVNTIDVFQTTIVPLQKKYIAQSSFSQFQLIKRLARKRNFYSRATIM